MVSDRPKPCGQQATAIGCGYIVIGAAYTRAMKGKPGDEFEIKLGYKNIILKAIEQNPQSPKVSI
jgi:hypothetical protein